MVIGPIGTFQHSVPHLSSPPNSTTFSISHCYIWKRLNYGQSSHLVLGLGVTCVRFVTTETVSGSFTPAAGDWSVLIAYVASSRKRFHMSVLIKKCLN